VVSKEGGEVTVSFGFCLAIFGGFFSTALPYTELFFCTPSVPPAHKWAKKTQQKKPGDKGKQTSKKDREVPFRHGITVFSKQGKKKDGKKPPPPAGL